MRVYECTRDCFLGCGSVAALAYEPPEYVFKDRMMFLPTLGSIARLLVGIDVLGRVRMLD